MHNNRKKTVGIIGGMGPFTTSDLFHRIISYTNAAKDQDHIEILIVNDPKIPDRTKSIQEDSVDAYYEKLLTNAKKLVHTGADFLVIPCNTSHFWLSKLENDISVPILNMIQGTKEYVEKNYSTAKNLGILATDGTIKSKLYESYFDTYTITTPNPDVQQRVMDLIYGENGIKAGSIDERNKNILIDLANILMNDGADHIVLGCTELSLFYGKLDKNIFIDPIEILAKNTIKYAGY